MLAALGLVVVQRWLHLHVAPLWCMWVRVHERGCMCLLPESTDTFIVFMSERLGAHIRPLTGSWLGSQSC